MRLRLAAGSILCAAGLAVLGPGAGPAAAQGCAPKFDITDTSYDVRLCGMPDFDQRRVSAALRGDGRSILVGPSLPGDGGCHCVPTSMTNLLGYYLGKGVKAGSALKHFAWGARQGYVARPGVAADQYLAGQPYPSEEVAAYNATTSVIRHLGTEVKTVGGCGTTFQSVLKYAEKFRDVLPEMSFVAVVNDVGPETPREIAEAIAAGATVNVAYGWYNESQITAHPLVGLVGTMGPRTGGHVVTVSGVAGTARAATLSTSDPARVTDPAEAEGEDKFRQSAFGPSVAQLERVYAQDTKRYLWRWNASARFFDQWMAVYPTSAVLASGGTLSFVPGLAFNQKGTPPVPFRPRRISVGGMIEDAVFLPSSGEIAYVRRGDNQIRAVGVGSGRRRVLGPAPTGATQITADPTGRLVLAAGRNEVVQLSPSADPGNPGGPRMVTRMKVGSAVRALAYDASGGPGNGRVAIVTADARLRQVAAGSLTPIGSARRLSKSALAGSGRVSADVDRNGRLIVRRGSSESLAAAPLRGGKAGRRKVNRLEGAGGLAMTDRGTVLSVAGGKLVELRADGTAAPRSALHGRKVSGRVVSVTKTGTSLSAAEAQVVADQRVIDPLAPELAP